MATECGCGGIGSLTSTTDLLHEWRDQQKRFLLMPAYPGLQLQVGTSFWNVAYTPVAAHCAQPRELRMGSDAIPKRELRAESRPRTFLTPPLSALPSRTHDSSRIHETGCHESVAIVHWRIKPLVATAWYSAITRQRLRALTSIQSTRRISVPSSMGEYCEKLCLLPDQTPDT